MLGTFQKAFFLGQLPKGIFLGQLPKGIFPSGNFLNVEFPKSVLAAALGLPYGLTAALAPLFYTCCSTRLTISFEPPRSAHYPFLAAALGPLFLPSRSARPTILS